MIWKFVDHGLQERLKFEFFGLLEIQLNYQKMVLEVKISWVIVCIWADSTGCTTDNGRGSR